MKILITGANGFIGSHLLRYFSGMKEHFTCGLVRKTSDLSRLADGNYHLVIASLQDPLEGLLAGFDAVIHTAALSLDWGDYRDFYRSNVEGSVRLLRAARRSGVKRFIHLSSTVVYGFGGNRMTEEDRPFDPFPNPYCLTKVRAEEKLKSSASGIELVILRPSNVIGPDDLTTTYPLIRAIKKGMIAFPAGGRYLTSPCSVKNLVAAVDAALTAPEASGEAFNISDGNDITWKDLLALIAEKAGGRAPRFSIPLGLLRKAAGIMEKIYLLRRSSVPPIITPYRIAQVAADYSFSIDKARSRLGYDPPFTTEDEIERSVAWYNRLAG